MRGAARRLLAAGLGLVISLHGPILTGQAAAGGGGGGAAPIAPGDWPMAGRDAAGTRFSPLTQLTPVTVTGLKVIWTFGTGSIGGHEGNPLVAGGRLYLVTPYPNTVYAFDLDRPGDPPLWRHATPRPRAAPLPSICCGMTNRGLAWHPSGLLLVPLFPGDLVALDGATGKERWRARVGDPALGQTLAGPPLVAGEVVIAGVGGGEYGARGYLSAYAARTGQRLWRGFSAGPDADVLLAGTANPSYPSHHGADLGQSTWAGESWRRGGGATWGGFSYDPDLDLVYYGTGAPAPLNADQRAGDNKWASSLIAREARTGAVRWALQLTPGDRWGYDASNESILADLELGGRGGGGGGGGGAGGRPARALVHFDRNGFAYTVDRATGRILLAEKYGPANWAARIDLATGLPVRDPRFAPRSGTPVRGVCPSLFGMKTFQPAAFSPQTGLAYVPGNNLCMDLEPLPASFQPGKAFLGAAIRLAPGPGGEGNRGRLVAWDPTTGSIAWEVRETFPVLGGALATAGGLVFYGTLEGWLKALDAKTGREVWRFKTPSGIIGNPITFAAPDGRQYLAVVSGVGGWAGFGLGGGTDSTAGLGAAGILSDLGRVTNPGGVLLVFGL